MADKLIDKLRKLKKLAEDQAGLPEGKLAQSFIEELLKKYPDLSLAEEKVVKWDHVFKNPYHKMLWRSATQAHDLKCWHYKGHSHQKIMTEGLESDMMIARAEWEHAVREFDRMVIQVVRGINNKIFPQICKPIEETDTEPTDDDMEELCSAALKLTKPCKKALNGKGDEA